MVQKNNSCSLEYDIDGFIKTEDEVWTRKVSAII